MAYVTDGEGAESVSGQPDTRSVGLPIPTGSGSYPYFVTMTPDGKTVYTADYHADAVHNTDLHHHDTAGSAGTVATTPPS